MGSHSGKTLAIVAGILVVVATFITSWFSVLGTPAHGLGLLNNIGVMFTSPEVMANAWGIPSFVPYILGGVFLFFLVSWLLIFIGTKSRACAIIGAIMPIFMGWAVIAGYFNIPPDLMQYTYVFLGSEMVPGVIPFSLPLMTVGSVSLNLGAFLLMGGGILGFISGCMRRQ